MIIGLSGYAGAGKDTVGQILVEEFGYTRKAFADKVKEAACVLLDIPIENVDFYKNDPAREVGVFREGNLKSGTWFPIFNKKPITFRHFLQRMGTEVGRDIFGKDFWLDMVIPFLDPEGYAFSKDIPELLVITDVRFENEVKRIRDLKGKVIRVSRRSVEPDTSHISEQLPDYDIEIENNDTIDYLRVNIKILMETHVS